MGKRVLTNSIRTKTFNKVFKMEYMLNLTAFLFVCLNVACAEKAIPWTTKPEFANKLPKTVAPTWEGKVKAKGECSAVCQLKQCSSFAYSDISKSCKVYTHTNLMKPLPDLTNDWSNQKHQMYYKREFCPYGWDSDPETGKCYFIDDSLSLKRFDAWGVCEEHGMSELVMFQSAKQRDNLYDILRNNHNQTSNFWNGYYQFYSNYWIRPVNEIPGYLFTMRGDCINNDLPGNPHEVSIEECAAKCDKEFRDKCVGFMYQPQLSRCFLKHKLCPVNNQVNPVTDELHVYNKIHGEFVYHIM